MGAALGALAVTDTVHDASIDHLVETYDDWSWSLFSQIALYGVGVLGAASAGYIYFTAGPPIPVPDALRMQ